MHSDSSDHTTRHPSGLTLERWLWPFKTEDERKLVAQYFRKLDRLEKTSRAQQRLEQISRLPDAPF